MKKVFLISSALLLAISTILVVKTSNSVSSFDLNVEALADGESSSTCYSGGKGAISCEIASGIDLGERGISGGCSVTCGGSYYACCDIHCSCIFILDF